MTIIHQNYKYEFKEVEYVSEFLDQYLEIHKEISNGLSGNMLLYNFACDVYEERGFDKNINIVKTIEEYGSMYGYLSEDPDLIRGEADFIIDFIAWLPQKFFLSFDENYIKCRIYWVSGNSYPEEDMKRRGVK
jgi:hypothetical protein|tara:strand:- start:193 stop:591 length:399 start_codon:yes stop_codon:yes gene_type:complete